MHSTPQQFVADHYASRAQDYLTSVNHSTGDDLAQLGALLFGQKEAQVLDLGCGGGHVAYRAAPHVERVTACDVTRSMLDLVDTTARERGLTNIVTVEAAAEALPFETATFDWVLTRFSTHHWHSMEAGLAEARRVLKPGGHAVFMDVIAPADAALDTHLQTVELLRDLSHVRDYSLAEWHGRLAKAGFTVRETTQRRLRMDFAVWIARTHALPLHAEAIRSLQLAAPALVQEHFAIERDGSFHIDTATLVADTA